MLYINFTSELLSYSSWAISIDSKYSAIVYLKLLTFTDLMLQKLSSFLRNVSNSQAFAYHKMDDTLIFKKQKK